MVFPYTQSLTLCTSLLSSLPSHCTLLDQASQKPTLALDKFA